MKKGTMIWVISAIVYLGIVIAGYSVYASINLKTADDTNHIDTDHGEDNPTNHAGENANTQKNDHGHESVDHLESTASEVTPTVSYANGEMIIGLEDKNNHEPELEVSHEKYMHLIVVSSDLEEYHHLHPEKNENGLYSQTFNLAANSYKVFVDIKPKGLNYSIKPNKLNVGKSEKEPSDNHLIADTNFTKTINGQTVELTAQSFKANQDIMLNFDVKDVRPKPYLGALGHVVILDEHGERFIHVHPVSDDQTVFETQFNQPGIYKLWAEFKFGEQVNVYPFVIEVE